MGLFRDNDWWLERKQDYQQDPAPYQLGGFVLCLALVMVVAFLVISRFQPDYSEEFDRSGEDYQLGPAGAEVATAGEQPTGDLLAQANSVVERRRQMQTLVERVYQAAGSKAQLEELRSIRKSGWLEQGGETFEVSYQYKRPNLFRFTVVTPQGSLREGFNGKQAWQQLVYEGHYLPPKTLEGEDARMTAGNAELVFPITSYLDNWDDLTWRDSTTVDGREAYVIEYRGQQYHKQTFYIDKQTYEVLRREREHTTDAGGVETIAVVFGDYRHVDGFYIPFSETVYVGGQLANRFTLESAEPNVGMPDSFFSPNPADIELREAGMQGQAKQP